MTQELPPTIAAVADRQGGVFLRRQAIEAGYSRRVVDDAIAAKQWRRVRFGAYCLPELFDAIDEPGRARLRAHAVIAASEVPLVLSGASAAVFHGLDLDQAVDLRTVDVTHPGRSSRRERDTRHRNAALAPADLTEIAGLTLTSVARTAVDIARDDLPFSATMITIDSALRYARTTEHAMHLAGERASRWPGARPVSTALSLADGRSQTAGETLLRMSCIAQGVVELVPQVGIFDEHGELLGIADLVAFDRQTVLEMDGLVKYGIDGADPRVQLVREKRREDGIRRGGLEVERFGWAEARSRAYVGQRMAIARERAVGRPPPTCLYRFSEVSPDGIQLTGPLMNHEEARSRLRLLVEQRQRTIEGWHRAVS